MQQGKKERSKTRPADETKVPDWFDKPVDAHARFIVSEEREKIDARGNRYSDFEVVLEMTAEEYTYVARFIRACRGKKAA